MKTRQYSNLADLFPTAIVELKFGVNRKRFNLEVSESSEKKVTYKNEWIEVKCERKDIDNGSIYSLSIKNLSRKHIRITRLRLSATDGIGSFLENTNPSRVSFLRNGYQSWSTARTYRVSEKPLRPRFKLISLATSNMANLPSNIPGILSSEMYSIIMDLDSQESMLVGQLPPFNQFFYILLNINARKRMSYFELIYDFGRQLLESNKVVKIDGILFLKGSRPTVEQEYFHKIQETIKYKPPKDNLKGWCSWYQYYDKITPEILYKNLKSIKDRGMKFDFFQIDDGYQKAVGDWLQQKPIFDGKMKELTHAIKDAGMKPGIWIAPFSVASKSELYKMYPEYILKDEYGKKIKASYNPWWKCYYYGLDVTHPRFVEYLKEIIDTYVNDWGFEYLKCDFLFTACLRGAVHHELTLSRASVLKRGMQIIRESAGKKTKIIGCGMPLSAGIGLVDAMRVGPDTGGFWINPTAKLVRTGCMFGVRNSMRNFMVRSPMHKRMWLNDPDCAMIRDKGTRLSEGERMSQINAIALSGGILLFSDDFTTLSNRALEDMALMEFITEECFKGQAVALDVMEHELPEMFYNTAGYLGLFNFQHISLKRVYDLSRLYFYNPSATFLEDVRSGERIKISSKTEIGKMLPRGSRLFKVID